MTYNLKTPQGKPENIMYNLWVSGEGKQIVFLKQTCCC